MIMGVLFALLAPYSWIEFITTPVFAQSSHHLQQSASSIIFHDAEPVPGTVDKHNVQFHLLTFPVPSTSLILVVDGKVLVQGLDYELGRSGEGATVTVMEAPQVNIVGWYRSNRWARWVLPEDEPTVNDPPFLDYQRDEPEIDYASHCIDKDDKNEFFIYHDIEPTDDPQGDVFGEESVHNTVRSRTELFQTKRAK